MRTNVTNFLCFNWLEISKHICGTNNDKPSSAKKIFSLTVHICIRDENQAQSYSSWRVDFVSRLCPVRTRTFYCILALLFTHVQLDGISAKLQDGQAREDDPSFLHA